MISSQLAHRGWCCPTARVLTLREDYLSACDGSLPEALLLQAIAWKTRADDPDAWLEHGEAQWASEMFDAKTLRSARRRLVARGLIEADTNLSHGVRRSIRLRINGPRLQKALSYFEEFLGNRGKFPPSDQRLRENFPTDYGKNTPDATGKFPYSYIGNKNSSQKKQASYPDEQNSSRPDSLSSDWRV